MRKVSWPLALLVILSAIATVGKAQVNGYAQVTAISSATLTLTNVDETFDTFESGEFAILMQMQDDVIGSNTNDDASFGTLASIASAGLYEIVEISSVTESGGTPTSITLTSSPTQTYNTGSNSRVQLISYPELGAGSDYTTTADINAVSWDGNIGGVIAFFVTGTLRLDHSINADGQGFRGAGNNITGSSGCNSTVYRTSTQANFADKGEGIYLNTNSGFTAGRGHILTGGGGGNSHNAGGGGGGNYSAGGTGGPGFICNPTAGGLGGIALSSEISVSRIFMGGGGGGGEINNAGPGHGQNGGGIILIKATELETSGTCGGVSISANGDNASPSTQDGAGGGGAGGSIVLQIDAFDVVSTCALTVSADGGDGGDVNHANQHGGGGGGGQGVVYYSIAQPTSNITSTTDPGMGGLNNSSGSSGSAVSGGGISGGEEGVFDGGSSPLPIELLSFEAIAYAQGVDLQWTTATEINNHFFTIERSADSKTWEEISWRQGAGTSYSLIDYEHFDDEPLNGRSYYRLKQTDFNGTFTYSETVAIFRGPAESPSVSVFPNPARDFVNVALSDVGFEQPQIQLFDPVGRLVELGGRLSRTAEGGTIRVQGLVPGIYLLIVQSGDLPVSHKVVIR